MKKTKTYLGYTAIEWTLLIIGLALLASSCTGVRKDCRGVKHYKHENGFYI